MYEDTWTNILMYLIIHLCFYIFFTGVKYVPEFDQDRLKHVGVMKNDV